MGRVFSANEKILVEKPEGRAKLSWVNNLKMRWVHMTWNDVARDMNSSKPLPNMQMNPGMPRNDVRN
jgi:hypothetical protein